MSGGPLLNAEGEGGGVNTLLRPDLRGLGNLAIASVRVQQAIQAIELAEAIPESNCIGWRVVLFNDRFNRRERVQKALMAVGLNEREAHTAMMAAHTTGRGVVRVFNTTAGEMHPATEVQKAAE